jgi:hypothetical protein
LDPTISTLAIADEGDADAYPEIAVLIEECEACLEELTHTFHRHQLLMKQVADLRRRVNVMVRYGSLDGACRSRRRADLETSSDDRDRST